jgi:surface protein
MFGNNSNFNQPLNNWNVSNVNNWQNFMNNTDAFNQDLSSWSPSSATIFRTAFRNMANFEGIGVKEWDVSSCTDFFGVFANCASFAEDLSAGATGSWQMESASNMADMFLDTTLTTEKYDNLLYHFANLPSVPTSITFHGGDSYYTDTTSHDALTGTYSWTITDLGVLPYEDHVLADSPIVYYQFEDGTGATEVADSSGNDHHGTISNTVELGATGINSGYCINVVDDASLESGISLPLLTSGSTGATDFSIEWWMKPENVITGDIRIFSSTSGATAKRLEFFIRASKLRSMIGSDGSATFIDTAFNADEWSHIVITYKQSNGETKGYLNGVLSDTITETTGYGGFNQGEAYHLGYSPNYGAQYEGLIDEFAMYEHILSADRVAAHYNART